MLRKFFPGSLMTTGVAAGCLLLSGSAAGQEQGYPDPVVAPSYVIGDTEVAQPTVETVISDATLQAAPSTEAAPTVVEGEAAADCGCASAEPLPAATPAVCGCGNKKCGGFLCRDRKAPPKPKPNPCAGSHKPLFYANDFSYLGKDDYSGSCFGDSLKQMDVGRCGKLDIGGQLRHRYHSERGMGRQAGVLGFQDTQNDFSLYRARLYANYKVNEDLRFFAEGIYADVGGAEPAYLPRGIDRNRGDFLNLFADVALTEDTIVRIGRQELLFGAQRLVSPLDWANTRRTFDGVRTITKTDNLSLDMFYTQFVPVAFDSFDNADENNHFYGGYATFSGMENATVDMYVLGSNNENMAAPIASNFHLQTYGSRIQGVMKNDLLYEVEAAYQTGVQRGLDANHEAFAYTVGLGRKFGNHPWNPVLWGFYDFASGNDSGDADFNRFNQLFPLAHKYLGFIDAVARSNVASPNVRLAMTPTSKLNLLMWYHHFDADEADDVIPGVAVPSAQNLDTNDFGNELDFIANYRLTARASILAGYSHLWRGAKIIGDTDADFFYLQTTVNF